MTPDDIDDFRRRHGEYLDHVYYQRRADYLHKCEQIVNRLASMPSSDEDMIGTWCPPEYDDLHQWWKQYVEEARQLTGFSYRG